jgi:hypothetical protein
MSVKKPPDGQAGLRLKDHEEVSRRLLLARGYLARVAAQVRADGAWRWGRSIAHTVEAAIRQLDRARDELAAALAQDHPITHPALAKRVYYPQDPPQGGREEGVDVTQR